MLLKITVWDSLMSLGASWHCSVRLTMIEWVGAIGPQIIDEERCCGWVGKIKILKMGQLLNGWQSYKYLKAKRMPSLASCCKKWGKFF